MERKQEISDAVIGRMPRYYRYICKLEAEGIQRISSKALAEQMGLTASQIRQDFNCFGGFGQQGYGYNIEKLKEELANILGLHSGRTAILVGVGNLGRALLNNFDFEGSGFRVLYAFDCDLSIVGQQIGKCTVRKAEEMHDYVLVHKPDVAVLTLSRKVAPAVARNLVEDGIKGLWNFTGEDLHLEGLGIPVENVHLSDSMMRLSQFVNAHESDHTEA